MSVQPPWEKDKPFTVGNKNIGYFPYILGGMSFIPIIGVLFGVISVLWGIVKWGQGGRMLVFVGLGGVLMTASVGVIGYSVYKESMEEGVWSQSQTKLVKAQLFNAVLAIETYKIQNGKYPKSLNVVQELLPKDSLPILRDPMSSKGLFYYKLVNKNAYHIRSSGADKTLNTSDDILPGEVVRTGLIANYTIK